MTMRIDGILAAAILIATAFPARAQEAYPTPEATVKDLVASAQGEYLRLEPENNRLREYARRFVSTPGTHDGLYWPPENQADISPLDGFVQDANLASRTGEKPEPYDGYYFRILTAQGPAAP